MEKRLREIKARLTAAFAEIRRNGLMARQNYLCCSNCALSDASIKCCVPGRKEHGVVYYHAQDGEGLAENGICAIRFASFNRDHDPSTKEIGQITETALVRQGLTVDWGGDPGKVIFVSMPEAA